MALYIKDIGDGVKKIMTEEEYKKSAGGIGCGGSLLVFILLALFGGGIFDNEESTTSKSDEKCVECTENQRSEVLSVLSNWDKGHNENNAQIFQQIYGRDVYYYQTDYSLKKVIDSKTKLLQRNPSFHQESRNPKVSTLPGGDIRIDFEKNVWTDYPNGKSKMYPSYLILRIISQKWKIVTDGDAITDANLSKKGRSK